MTSEKKIWVSLKQFFQFPAYIHALLFLIIIQQSQYKLWCNPSCIQFFRQNLLMGPYDNRIMLQMLWIVCLWSFTIIFWTALDFCGVMPVDGHLECSLSSIDVRPFLKCLNQSYVYLAKVLLLNAYTIIFAFQRLFYQVYNRTWYNNTVLWSQSLQNHNNGKLPANNKHVHFVQRC